MPFDRDAFLQVHLPYRLQAVYGLGIVCDILTLPRPPTRVRILFDEEVVADAPTYRIFTNAMYEFGLVHCRGLLSFLGLGLDQRSRMLVPTPERSRADDITMESLGLTPVGVDELCRAPGRTPSENALACSTIIFVAHKGVAHLTNTERPANMLSACRACSEIVPWAIKEFVYIRLGVPIPANVG